MEIQVEIKTLTPIWTGGVDTKSDRIHETGILGSMRWWYEAIVLGLGGSICDSTADDASNRCVFEQKQGESFKDAYARLCPVCQLFGATGLQRRFRLEVVDDQTQPLWSGDRPLNIRPPDRTGGWYLPPGRVGKFKLRIIGEPESLVFIAALLHFMERWGCLGAKPQLGYGFIQIIKITGNPQLHYKWESHGNRIIHDSVPDLRSFTFFTLKFEPKQDDWWHNVPGIGALARDIHYRNIIDSLIYHRLMPTTPALKNVLRYGKQWSTGSLPHHFFGTLRGDERRRSKIALSWAYQIENSSLWEIRGWAYPPHIGSAQKAEIQQQLQTVLGKPDAWLRALNIQYRSAEISFTPKTTFFHSSTSEEIQNLVNEATTARRQV